ncbi:MAG: type II toxin-antitoxin system HicA family toxin [Prevotellaceae bacterium]|jgi:predicted RNA binding protein YcfA (HicA-like mRNA interferase family)|nr:type II toxin-antitoxin system HicA family toxin [Prevotellaceae bacterium]
MNWNEMRRKAIEHGFVFREHGKRHDVYKNPTTGKKILLERHWSQEVRPGIMNKLKKEIGF